MVGAGVAHVAGVGELLFVDIDFARKEDRLVLLPKDFRLFLGKKVIIRDLVLKGIKIKMSADLVGGDIATTTISEIHLRNIGEKQNGA